MGKIAFVFAGQGAQYAGMGKELYDTFDSARQIFDLAGEELRNLAFYGPGEELSLTVNTQPCLYAMDLASARVLNEHGIYADGVAGFSLGEIPALTYAGVFSDIEGLDFVRFRALAMHECSEENRGVMFAVLKCPADEVERLCRKVPDVYPVNYNCEGQTVVACGEGSQSLFQELAAESGARLVKLAVSGPFHSPFMDKASDRIAGYLKDFVPGKMTVPVYSNVTADIYGNISGLLAKQVNSPVMWQKTIEKMVSDGFDTFIEVGAGKTLSGLIKKISSSVLVQNVCDKASLDSTLEGLRV